MEPEPSVTPIRTSSGLPTVVVFALALLLVSLSLGTAALPLAQSAFVSRPTAAAATARAVSSPRAAATVADVVRVANPSATSEALATGGYRVTYTWVLDGARQGDVAVIRFFVGSRSLGEQRGSLDTNVFNASTGRLTITASQECSVDGWSAELVAVRGQPASGDTTARAAGVKC